MLTGRFDGNNLDLPACLLELRTIQAEDTINKYYNPELFETIMQAIERGRVSQNQELSEVENAKDTAIKKANKITL